MKQFFACTAVYNIDKVKVSFSSNNDNYHVGKSSPLVSLSLISRPCLLLWPTWLFIVYTLSMLWSQIFFKKYMLSIRLNACAIDTIIYTLSQLRINAQFGIFLHFLLRFPFLWLQFVTVLYATEEDSLMIFFSCRLARRTRWQADWYPFCEGRQYWRYHQDIGETRGKLIILCGQFFQVCQRSNPDFEMPKSATEDSYQRNEFHLVNQQRFIPCWASCIHLRCFWPRSFRLL